MTLDQIEREVQHRVDAINCQYMGGKMTDEEYASLMRNIHGWAELEYRWSEAQARAARRNINTDFERFKT